jgi:hypothetical protein
MPIHRMAASGLLIIPSRRFFVVGGITAPRKDVMNPWLILGEPIHGEVWRGRRKMPNLAHGLAMPGGHENRINGEPSLMQDDEDPVVHEIDENLSPVFPGGLVVG